MVTRGHSTFGQPGLGRALEIVKSSTTCAEDRKAQSREVAQGHKESSGAKRPPTSLPSALLAAPRPATLSLLTGPNSTCHYSSPPRVTPGARELNGRGPHSPEAHCAVSGPFNSCHGAGFVLLQTLFQGHRPPTRSSKSPV